ncbi:S24/S26 family peptidase [Pseudonocardia charpentierae]|uniref:Signal peptidase I n=1 Tax=Pseudonocardia charpentierae TaxID=3075545 RepID=A0ABU2N471_9PSEU|nr:hypothetical protein [Pseudonocardia sp. DSM 45834]MDT0348104.1 hypothetical protein [Pseudonocardia sp. DSM 45834]
MTEHRLLRVLREVALTVGAVVGTLCLVFTLLSATVGVRPLVFISGSMAPAIETGDLAVTRPAELARLARGDVVSVFDARGVRITHAWSRPTPPGTCCGSRAMPTRRPTRSLTRPTAPTWC